MRIYTRQGDEGLTRLAGGERIPKHDHRVELYGTVDELNSFLGLAIVALDEAGEEGRMRAALATQQNLLFELGSELAGFETEKSASVIFEEDVTALERAMDAYMDALPPLRTFILPGGTQGAAALHVGRTVCRRLERLMAADLDEHKETTTVRPLALKYANRLSDYLFVCARMANHLGGRSDAEWHSRAKGD